MGVKNFYYLKLLPIVGFGRQNLQYSILPIKKDSKYGYYTYSLLGKFEKIDFSNNLIYLKDKKDQTYAITYIIKRVLDNPKLVYFDYYDFVDKNSPIYNTVNINVFEKEKTVVPFKVGDILEIRWEDFRTLNQILAKKNGNEVLIENEGILKNVTQVINRYLYEN